MTPQLLLQHFDRIGEAPEAIPRLRRFILDLAVRGKLVEQDPRDEPASELFKRIQLEKIRLFKAGEVRKEKFQPLVEENEVHFPLPVGWELVRIRQVTSDRGQKIPEETFTYIDVTAINKEIGRIADAKVLSASDAPSRARKLVSTGDVLYSCVRPYLLNIAVIENDITPPPIASTAFAVLNGFGLVLSKYIWIVLRSPFMVECVEGKMRGQAYPAINDSDFALLPFPLPPLAEQHRIVAKVDELMALCDRLEAAQTERESRRDRLVASSLHHLNNGADPDAFREHARFYFNHLPRLTTRTDHIKKLRQTILNLAVRGKLVEQDPTDEPTSELLKRIQAEKAQLVKEGKIRPEKLPLPARADELDFELKPGWQAARISEILVELQTGPFGSSLHQSDYQKGGIPVINPASIKNERLVPVESMAVGPKTLERLATFKLREGDIVMARRGEMGRCAFVTKQEHGWLCGTGSLILRLPKFVFPNFFVTLIGSPFVREYLGGSAVGATMQNLNQSILLNLVIGLPPLAEQHRIVAKVAELMALCDQLETQLTTTQSESRHLLESILHEALAKHKGQN
jgi:type I restriction enzyme S subunit